MAVCPLKRTHCDSSRYVCVALLVAHCALTLCSGTPLPTQRVFAHLECSAKRAHDMRHFVVTNKNEFGEPVNPLQQADATEFFSMLCDRLETALKGSPQAQLLPRIFGGSIVGQIACRGGCGTTSENVEPTSVVSLDVKGNKVRGRGAVQPHSKQS